MQNLIIKTILSVSVLIFSCGVAIADDAFRLAPDGSWVGGDPELAPDGSWVGHDPKLAPDGSWPP
jgi:hypothetical protein